MELKREPGASFGVCIVGGTVHFPLTFKHTRFQLTVFVFSLPLFSQVNIANDAQQISGIFIKNIIPSSPAELCRELKVIEFAISIIYHI